MWDRVYPGVFGEPGFFLPQSGFLLREFLFKVNSKFSGGDSNGLSDS